MRQSLSYHRALLMTPTLPELTAAEQSAIEPELLKVTQKVQASEYGFVRILADQTHADAITQAFGKIAWAKTQVVVGIGGSDLGGRTLAQVFQTAQNSSPQEVIFYGDTPDPAAVTALLNRIDISQTVFNIISKSGETVETMIQYLLLKRQVSDLTADWTKHFLFTTDQAKGILRQEADRHGITTVPVPDDVGGRFSVLSSVGLVPALGMGVEVRELLDGARDWVRQPELLAISRQLALDQYRLLAAGRRLSVCMPYSSQLEEFGRWFRQLWAESLGKDGTGILPIQARGPADQHSQLQFYMQGTDLVSVLFIRIEERGDDFTVPETDTPELAYLGGHSFQTILNIEQQTTAAALYKVGRPSTTLVIDRLDAYALGQLFMCFEVAVVYLGALLGINPFDQPGVELSKQFMYGLLGRAGFEDQRREFQKLSHE